RMASDADLILVRKKRRDALGQSISATLWPRKENEHGSYSGGGGGGVPRGTMVETPQGTRAIETLRPGDLLESREVSEANSSVTAAIVSVICSRSPKCLRLNRVWLVTPSQPVLKETEWVEARTIKSGDRIMDGHGALIRIHQVETVEGYFEV